MPWLPSLWSNLGLASLVPAPATPTASVNRSAARHPARRRPRSRWSERTRSTSRICISRNPDWQGDALQRKWVVIVDGRARLASEIAIHVAFDPAIEPCAEEMECNYVCQGSLRWSGDIAVIT